jgi:hypothetical protein
MGRSLIHLALFLDNSQVVKIRESFLKHFSRIQIFNCLRSAGAICKLLGCVALDGQQILFGDAVQMNPTGPSGFLIPWVNGAGTNTTSMLTGIFLGCEYYSTSQKKTIYNNYWPGSDATGDVRAYVLDDPLTILEVQAGVAATPFNDLNKCRDWGIRS